MDATIDQIAAQNAALAEQNRQLMERLSALESRVPAPEPEPLAAGVRLEFPRVMYRLMDDLESDAAKKQIDVPGNDLRVVNGGDELEAAVKEGWKLQPVPVPAKARRK